MGPGAIFNEAMHTCQCQVAKTYSKCSSRTHVMALDYRAATLEAMGKLDLARRDAEWLLELAPRNMEVGPPPLSTRIRGGASR
jgi:F-box/TPR repeat protein Pof3